MHLVLYIFIRDYAKFILIIEAGKAEIIILLYLNMQPIYWMQESC
jgi:hypothetical protein